MVDANITDAVDLWIKHGISPGSFAMLMLEGKYGKAKRYAHPIILPYMNDHIVYFESLPENCRGTNVKTWKGTETK